MGVRTDFLNCNFSANGSFQKRFMEEKIDFALRLPPRGLLGFEYYYSCEV